jgi:hypothetical protein
MRSKSGAEDELDVHENPPQTSIEGLMEVKKIEYVQILIASPSKSGLQG